LPLVSIDPDANLVVAALRDRQRVGAIYGAGGREHGAARKGGDRCAGDRGATRTGDRPTDVACRREPGATLPFHGGGCRALGLPARDSLLIRKRADGAASADLDILDMPLAGQFQ